MNISIDALLMVVVFNAVLSLSVAIFVYQRSRLVAKVLAGPLHMSDVASIKVEPQINKNPDSAEIKGLHASSIGLGKRIQSLEAEIHWLREKQSQFELHSANQGPYAQAIRMASSGASSNDLAHNCGLSPREAELIVSLHASSHGMAEA